MNFGTIVLVIGLRGLQVSGMTPLMMALMTCQYDGAGALIAEGAYLDLRNARLGCCQGT